MPHAGDLAGVQWVDAPGVGNARFLSVLLTDARSDLPTLQMGEGEAALGAMPMSNGWHMVVLTSERPLQDHERAIVTKLRDEMRIGTNPAPEPGSGSAAVVWVTTSPDGPPLSFPRLGSGDDESGNTAR
jgi:hypothetical protein